VNEEMDPGAFKTFIHFQLKEYVQRQMAKAAGSRFSLSVSFIYVYACCVIRVDLCACAP
jgi:hypothetical protein